MMRHLNIADLLVIGFSAFVMIYGINCGLRAVNMKEYQA